MPLPPIWLTADAQNLNIPGLNVPFATLVRQTGAAVRSYTDPVVATNTKAQQAISRVTAWYNERLNEEGSPQSEVAQAAAQLLEDTFTTGVHAFMPFPDFGGLPELQRSLNEALNQRGPNAPAFSDDMYAAGALLVVSGGRMQVLAAASALLALMGGNKAVIEQALMAMFTQSNPMTELAEGAMAMGASLPENWTHEQAKFFEIFDKGQVTKFITGFPASLLQDLNAPSGVTVEPEQAARNLPFTVKVSAKGVGVTGVGVRVGGLEAKYVSLKGPHQIEADFDAADWRRMAPDADGHYEVALTSQSGASRVIMTLEAVADDPLSRLAESSGIEGALFGEWKALTVGDVTNAFVPGATQFASQAAGTMERLGAASREGGNIVTAALDAVGRATTESLSDVSGFASGIDESVEGFLGELAAVSVSTLLIPPSKGGIHQLNFALGQGLSAYAPNAPSVTDDQLCFGLFLVAGHQSAVEVTVSLKKFGTLFGIPQLAQLT